MKKFDQATFIEVQSARDDGLSSKDISKEMGLDLEEVNKVLSFKEFSDYTYEEEIDQETKNEKILPAQSAYYKGLISKKAEENGRLKENRGWLLEQVYFLRKAVAFLEQRKQELENGIKGLEKNIYIGVSAMEQMEENNNFAQLSNKVKQKND